MAVLARQSSCKPIMELKYSIFCSMMIDVMLPHHMRGGGVAAPQQAGSDGAERAGKSNESVDTTSSA